MDIAIIIIITALVAIYIALPFFLKNQHQVDEGTTMPNVGSEDSISEKLKSLNNRKESLYSAITDIEFDYGLGKLSKEDFEELDNKYKLEAAAVLKQIDGIGKHRDIQEGDSDLEQEILSYRKIIPSDNSEDDEIEEEISAFRSANLSVNTLNSCKQCSAEYSSGDVFCSKCGAKLN